MNPWINWVKKIQAISQIGSAYSKDIYDLERYDQLKAISHEMIAHLADAPISQVDAFFLPDQGYATPKVDLRAGVFKDGNILLAKETTDGAWSLPGGWADTCESPKQGIEREVLEETGYIVKAKKLVGVKDRSLHNYTPVFPEHVYKLFFLCELIGGNPNENHEISEVSFFSLENLPPLSLSRIGEDDLHLLWQHHKDESLATYCD